MEKTRRVRVWPWLIRALMLIGVFSSNAKACSCAGMVRPPCGLAQNPAGLMLGTVLSMRVENNEHVPPDGNRVMGGGHRIVTIAVVEDFRGKNRGGDHIEVQTGMGGGDCGYPFRVGERYLVDLYEHDGTFSTGICGRTRPEAAAALILRELRAAKAGERFPDLTGSVIRYAAGQSANAKMPTAVPNVPVVLLNNGQVVDKAVTDADGVYQMAAIAPGAYTVRFELPEGLAADPIMNSKDPREQTFAILGSNGQSALCKVSLSVRTAARLTGHVVSPSGDGVEGSFGVFSRPAQVPSYADEVAGGFSDKDGSFDTGPLEGGDYWMYFRPYLSKQPFRLGPPVLLGAGSFRVEEGKALRDLTLVVPQ